MALDVEVSGTCGKDNRLLERWPAIPLLGLGLWVAWRLVAFSSTVPASFNADSTVFFVTMMLVCLVTVVAPRWLAWLTARPAWLVVAGALGAVGTLLLVVAKGTFVSVGAANPAVLAVVGSVCCGVGVTTIAIHSIELLGRLSPTGVWIWAAYTEILVVGLYFAIAGSFGLLLLGEMLLLPLLAGACQYLGDLPGSSLFLAREERERAGVSVGALVKFYLFVFLLSVTARFAKAASMQLAPEAGYAAGIAWPALARVLLALFIILAIVYFSRHFPFSKMCMFAVMVVIALVAGFLLIPGNGEVLFFASTLVHSTLECVTIAFTACLCFKTRHDPFFLAALALAALYGGSLAGDVLAALPLPLLADQSASLSAFACSAGVCVVFALVFFQEREFDALLGDVEDFYPKVVHGEQVDGPRQPEGEDGLAFGDEWGLTLREREVVERLQSGNTVTRIADNMGLSVHTVRGYIQSVYSKCGVHSRNELLDLFGHQG